MDRRPKSASGEMPELEILRSVFYYIFIIVAMPILSFFLSKVILFDGILGLDTTVSSVSSAVTAVVVLHIGLGMYIYRAYSEVTVKSGFSKED